MKMKMKTKINKEFAEAISSWLTIATVLTAGFYGVWEYLDHKSTVRVERSLAYVESYRSGYVSKSKLALNQLLADNEETLIAILKDEHLSDTERDTRYRSHILTMVSPALNRQNLEISFSFYEEIAICAERELCDANIIRSFFTADVTGLFNSYAPHVCSLRKQWNNDFVYKKIESFFLSPKSDICQSL